MAANRPTTIAGYIRAQRPEAQPHLRRMHKVLKSVAPKADEVIKWGVPFFVDPRFLFSFSAFTKYCVFVPTPQTLKAFREEIGDLETTTNFLKIPYSTPFPEKLIRKMAKYRQRNRGVRDGFW